MQRNVDHIPVGVELRHFDPVTQPDHVIGADLHRGDQRKDGVLEYQHEHCGHRSQTGEQQQGRAVHQHGDDEDGRSTVNEHLADLDITLDRAIGGVRTTLIDVVRQFQPAAQRNRDRQDDEARAQALDKTDHTHRYMRHRDDAVLDHECRHDIGQTRHDGADMPGFDLEREAVEHTHDDPVHDQLRDPIGQPGEQQEKKQG